MWRKPLIRGSARKIRSLGLCGLVGLGFVGGSSSLGLAAAPDAGQVSTAPGGCARTPNIVLISIDTLRADHLSAYGYGRPTSPALDALAAQGVRFEHAVAQASWTLPSMASVLTGLYPSEHGLIRADSKLSPQVETLAETLAECGYHSKGIVSHFFVDRKHGLAQGFDHWDESLIIGEDAVTSERLTKRAIGAIDQGEERQPFFLWVHYFDPHFSYVGHDGEIDQSDGDPRREFVSARSLLAALAKWQGTGEAFPAQVLAHVETLYDGEIEYTDRWIGRLLDRIRESRLKDSTVVIVVGDHGEYFLEKGRFFHGRDVYEPLVHVPLIMGGALPDSARGRTVGQAVETASIPRTIMGLLGVEDPPYQGEDLLQVAEAGAGSRAVFTEGSYAWDPKGRTRAVVQGDWKLIHNLDDDSFELYNLVADPEERDDLSDAHEESVRAVRRRLETALRSFRLRTVSRPERIELDDATVEQLEALGYLR